MAEGSTKFPVESINGFAVGDIVQIESISGTEKGRVGGFGSIVLECPSKIAHPAGSTITVLPASTFYAGCEGNTISVFLQADIIFYYLQLSLVLLLYRCPVLPHVSPSAHTTV